MSKESHESLFDFELFLVLGYIFGMKNNKMVRMKVTILHSL